MNQALHDIQKVAGIKIIPILFGIEPGIYFLIKNQSVVYVGQSVLVFSRIGQHLTDNKKDFDKTFAYYLPCTKEKLNEAEAFWIKKIKPKYNFSKQGKLISPFSWDDDQLWKLKKLIIE